VAAFQQVTEAYETLSDEFRKLMYDARRSAEQNASLCHERDLRLVQGNYSNKRTGSASMLPAEFYERSNALWSEQFRERQGKLERRPMSRPVSRQSASCEGPASCDGQPVTGLSGSATPLPTISVTGAKEMGTSHSSYHRPTSQQISSRQLLLRRTRSPSPSSSSFQRRSSPTFSEFIRSQQGTPQPCSSPDAGSDHALPLFRPINGTQHRLGNGPAASTPLSAAKIASSLRPEKHKKMSKQERTQFAASVKTLQVFFN
jgi:curved DNA-binding protein CbpA